MTTIHYASFGWLAVALGVLAGCAGTANRGSSVILREDTTGITVLGDGETDAPPDTATFQVGIEAKRPTVAEARAAGAQAAEALLAALRGVGVPEDAVQTTQLSIHPDYEYTEGGRNLLGYVASNMVEVEMKDLDKVGAAIDAATGAAGDAARLQGITFSLDDDAEARAEARRRAMEEAKGKAAELARLAGIELGKPVAIEESSSHATPPMPMMRTAAVESADETTPVRPGNTTVRVQVRIRYALAD